MPLRFRSVVPYTLPGVLALIGWWWYISRKKERPISHDSPDGAPTAMGLTASPAKGSNGLVEKATVSPTSNTEPLARTAAQLTEQRTEQESISCTHVQDIDTAPPLQRSSAETAAHLGRAGGQEVHAPADEDGLQASAKDHEDPGTTLPDASVTEPEEPEDPEEHPVRGPAPPPEASSHQATSSPPPAEAFLSDAQRPEPEGEVAKHHHGTVGARGEAGVCAATPPKVAPSTADSLETPPSAQDFHQHVLTSTPATPDPATQDAAVAPESPQDVQVKSGEGEERDLELLAAGLICEVISAATQEVLGVTPYPKAADGSSPVTPAQHRHRHPATSPPPTRAEPDEEQQGMANGCAGAAWEPVEAAHGGHRANGAPGDGWQGAAPPLSAKPRGEEAAALAEDSACSTCHSEDGVSSEDLQGSAFDHPMDAIQITDLSAGEAAAAEPPAGPAAEGAALAASEEGSDAGCEIKRLNGMDLRNGAQGKCDLETDQSGGSDVNSMDSVDSGCTMGAAESQSNHAASLGSELIIWEIEVPKHLVGRLIGKQGRFVSFLKQNSGAKIYISTLPYTQEFQICHIEGTQQQVDKALSLIGKKFKDLDLTNLYAAPPPPLTLPSLPMTSWLLLPSGVTVEVIVVNIVSAGHVFVQQHTHPTYHALRSLDQQMFLCYSQPGTPALPSPAEVGVICAAPAVEGAWWRAQVITFYKETNEVEIRYVDYGGYDRVKIDSLRQIRSDFVTLPFQGAEVLLDNIAPLPGEDRFSAEATAALEEMARGVALLAQVSNYDNNTGLPLVHLWNMVGDEVVSVNRTLAERGLGSWVDGF